MSIYTRTGDRGTTSLLGNTGRVPKDHPVIELLGALDELASWLGLARATVQAAPPHVEELLRKLPELLSKLMALAAAPDSSPKDLPETEVLERWIDDAYESLEKSSGFVTLGRTKGGSILHLARTSCRNAERRLVTASRLYPKLEALIPFLNRLSDALFLAARLVDEKR